MLSRPTLAPTLAALLLSACLPLPQATPERLTPRYLGSEAAQVAMNCAQTQESVWIEGPDQVRLRASPHYQPDQGLAQVHLRLVSSGPRRAIRIPPQALALSPLDGGPTRSLTLAGGTARPLTMTDPQREPIKELDLTLRIEGVPKAGLRLQLPEVQMDDAVWRPQALELRPEGPALRPTPFNC